MMTLDELVGLVELAELDYDELSARRNRTGSSEGAGGPDTNDLSVNATRRPDRIEVTCAVVYTATDATYRVAVRGTFQAAEPFQIEDRVMTGFVEQIGVMTLYPFLREAVRELSAKLGAEPALLGLIRPGQIQLGLQGKAGAN